MAKEHLSNVQYTSAAEDHLDLTKTNVSGNTQEFVDTIESQNTTPLDINIDVPINFSESAIFPDDYLILNDITLEDVPTTAISIRESQDVFIAETLRSKAPITKTQGRGNITVNITLSFPPGDAQVIKLRRLIAELSQHPLVFVYNNKIRSYIGVRQSVDNMIFILESGTIRTANETVGTLILDLVLHYFNYKPFSHHFWYNAKLPGANFQKDEAPPRNLAPIELGDLQGFESYDYALPIATERFISQLHNSVAATKINGEANIPATFPFMSETWMYYADHLVNSISSVNGYTSDYIGFKLRTYETHTPINPKARAGRGSVSSFFASKPYGAYPSPKPLYDARQQTSQAPASVQTSAIAAGTAPPEELGSFEQAVTSVETKPGNALVLYQSTDRKGKQDASGEFEPRARQFWHVYGGVKVGIAETEDKKARRLAVKYACELASGVRYVAIFCHGAANGLPSFGFNKSNVNQLSNYLSKCCTSDVVVALYACLAGKKFAEFLRDELCNHGFINCRVIGHTEAGIASLNPNKREYNCQGFFDYFQQYSDDWKKFNSLLKSTTRKGFKHLGGSLWLKLPAMTYSQIVAAVHNTNLGSYIQDINIQQISNKNPALDNKAQQAAQKYKNKGKQEPAKPIIEDPGYFSYEQSSAVAPSQLTETQKAEERSSKARMDFILNTQKSFGVQYYWDDPAVRNVFYRERGLHIGGATDFTDEEDARTTGIIGKDIVCSGMSITFGHRITPMKLVGQQQGYTWQFLGAGNKSGSIVLTFAGEQGHKAMTELKRIIADAKQNAQMFGSTIKDAGVVKLLVDEPYGGGRNTILTLLNVNDIIISDVEIVNDPEGANKFQAVLHFVTQEFAQEGYERAFASSFDEREAIIKNILKYVYWDKNIQTSHGNVNSSDENQYQAIKPRPELGYYRFSNATIAGENGQLIGHKTGGFYLKPRVIPIWLAEIILDAVEICRDINMRSPTTLWRTSKGTTETYRDRYAKVGAEDIVRGSFHNVYQTDYKAGQVVKRALGIPTTKAITKSALQNKNFADANTDTNLGQLDKSASNLMHDWDNGAPDTSALAARLHLEFLNRMDLLVDRVKKYMHDETNFDTYFPGIRDSHIEAITKNIRQCYEDMNLPSVPNGTAPLPPEFYVYDDSDEDPAVGLITDEQSTEGLMKIHIQNEMASMRWFLKDNLLGGSYVSMNLPYVLQNRLGWNEMFRGEDNFLNYESELREGIQHWEPVLYRNAGTESNTAGHSEWKSLVKDHLGNSDSEMRDNFMSDVIALSPYLKKHTLWREGDGLSSPEDQAIIAGIYGDDYQRLAFGPSEENARIDNVLSGNAGAENALTSAEQEQKQALEQAQESGNYQEFQTPSNQAAVATPDGGVILADQPAELDNDDSGLFSNLSVDKVVSFIDDWSPVLLGVGAIPTKLAIGAYRNFKQADEKTKRQKQKRQVIQRIQHHLANENFDPINTRATMAAGIALGTRAKDLSVRRAFPTFRIYFIEEDAEQTAGQTRKIRRGFDDFYSYAAIQEIKITRSRKIPADLAIIRMTNVAGILLRKRFGEKESYDTPIGDQAERASGIFADTERENPFEKMILQDGVNVQIRLGYASSPDLLETVFLGQIVEVAPSENGDILEIMCQGYGVELDAVELGPLEDGPVFYSTQSALSAAIIQDSIVHFGRRDKDNQFNIAEMRHGWTGGEGLSFNPYDHVANALSRWSAGKMNQLFRRYKFLNYPQDDNIFAPPPAVYSSTWTRYYNNACIYRPLKQTAWDIFKEHELRHPGYVASAVPYGHAPRMTMFFGAIGQNYWSRPPSDMEVMLSERWSQAIIKLKGMQPEHLSAHDSFTKKLAYLAKNDKHGFAQAIINDLSNTYSSPISVGFALGRAFGRYKPFRNYHYFDSSHHILLNQIRTSVDGTYNEMEVIYFKNEDLIQKNNAKNLRTNLQQLQQDEDGLLSMKLDDNIPEDRIRSYREAFPSCITEDMARRYAQGLFLQNLRDCYKGELIVLGEPTLKPFDVCMLSDTSINMHGPIEVEAVTHIFNREQGFISIITPDLCVQANEFETMATMDAVNMLLSYMYNTGSAITQGILLSTGAFSYLGAIGAAKLMMWMQDGAPVIMTPLTFEGKPFLSATTGFRYGSLFANLAGQWHQWWDDLGSAWNRIDIAEELFGARLSAAQWINEIGGVDANPGLEPSEQ